MSTIRTEADQIAREKADRKLRKMSGRFKVATLTPTFTVYMDGSPKAVEASWIPGLTYVVGTTGQYTHQQGQLPVCTPTKRGAYP